MVGSQMPNAAPRALTLAARRAPRNAWRPARKMVVVTDGDSKVLAIDNQDAVKEHAGHHVAVTGTVTKDSIHVNSVKMM